MADVKDDPTLPHWVVLVMLDGTVILCKDPSISTGRDIMVPRVKKGGQVEVAWMTTPDSECKELHADYIKPSVHVHYIRYFEVHPPTLEGAVIH